MFDTALRRIIDPPLNRAGRTLAARGWGADRITLAGLGLGLAAAALIAAGAPTGLALLPLLAGRLADGLDGAVARAHGKTDFGGYLDIACDFALYAAVPLAFALRAPDENAVPAAFLLATFYINAASFLGFATMAAKRGLETTAQGEKSLYYAAGLLEGGETIAFFVLLCLWPAAFPAGAWVFGGLCLVTATARILNARRLLG
ncbi:CDP-alcohol phosphatidyltransferase family protein [Pseudogemmobacter blasticus]|uniref:CDP-alcohol phosphatidyltransferase family protein n=1 Tax=Fuscovulum blasticum DSM 2131 TaxID=1188250 RepID=A0A2T4J622_FUSBL|nr:CDP-alcohol phosphatidyltransferase family protein [Fuscovulum blasticum]PTE13303.1 CDP-alcohol phosphatidyltransferase family protein [Fuscovulum blasticum DSM 2131]